VADTAIPFDDAVLVRQCRQGDLTAFEPLVVKYQDRIYNLCWRLCGDRQASEDLTQEAFLKAFEALPDFHGASGFYTWLYRIATNLALSYRRSERRHMNVAGRPQWNDMPSQAARLHRAVREADDRPDVVVQRDEVRQIIWQAIQQLDDDHRAVVALRDMEGLDYGEIAEVLQVPAGTVRSRLHRARMAIREKLLPLLGPDHGG
jgi:RNA polymerase sigma-70 factor (ECF subfamily)